MSLGPLYVLLGEVSAHFLIGLFVFLEWSHVSSLYILETRPLSEVSLANMFSHTVGSLFILSVLFLTVKTYLDLALAGVTQWLSTGLQTKGLYA